MKEESLDQNFALRAQNNLRDLVVNGKCGAFFGLWWTPNNPLMDVYEKDKKQTGSHYYLTAEYWKKMFMLLFGIINMWL